jgi:hypothetical protein
MLIFAAALFLFMGLGLAVDPSSYAQSAADWAAESGGKAGEARAAAVRWCRACGFLFVGVAVWLLAGAFQLPVGVPARLLALHPAPRARLAGGVAALFVSLGLSGLKMTEWAAGKRGVSFWSGWGVVFTLMAFGAFLLARLNVLQ